MLNLIKSCFKDYITLPLLFKLFKISEFYCHVEFDKIDRFPKSSIESLSCSDFGGVRNIRLPFQKVWRPDVILYNK